MRIFDSSGQQLAFNDTQDSYGTRLTITAPAAGCFYVGVSSASDFGYDPLTSGSSSGGNSLGTYTLNVARSPFAESGASSGTLQTADVRINGNAHVQGTIGVTNQDFFRLTVTDTGLLTASVTPRCKRGKCSPVAVDSLQRRGTTSDPSGCRGSSGTVSAQLEPVFAGWNVYYLERYRRLQILATLREIGVICWTPRLIRSCPRRSCPLPSPWGAGPLAWRWGISTATATLTSSPPTKMTVRCRCYWGVATAPSGPPSTTPWGLPVSVAVGDFNGDGNLDIVTANSDDTVSVLLGRGDGTFLPAGTYTVGDYPEAVAVGAFNGHPDIVTANDLDNTVSVLLGNGDGTFQPAVTYSVGNSPHSVVVGDFNNDGNTDIVTANSADNTVSVLLGLGDGTFQPAATYAVGNDPVSVAVGDFNGDGNLDIVTANAFVSPRTVSVLLGRGDGTFQPAATYAVGKQPDAVAVGDFSHDGNLDIVTANAGDGTVSVLLGQGDGTFQPARTYTGGESTPLPWRWGISTTTATSTSSPPTRVTIRCRSCWARATANSRRFHARQRNRHPEHSFASRPDRRRGPRYLVPQQFRRHPLPARPCGLSGRVCSPSDHQPEQPRTRCHRFPDG